MRSRTSTAFVRTSVVYLIVIQFVLSGASIAGRSQVPAPTLTQPAGANPALPRSQASPVPVASASPTPPPEKPFADIVKDAEVIGGLFTFYRKDEKVYLEIMPDQFDAVYLFSPTLESGIGERGFLSAQVMDDFAFAFQRRGKNVQLVAKNLKFRATDKGAIRRAVSRSFSDSVVGSTKVESLPHPDRKSILVDLSALMLTDIPMVGYALEATYRMPYKLDAKTSAFTAFKGFQDNNEVEALLNYTVDKPPLAPLTPLPVPMPNPPLAPPDMRSLQFRVRYSMSKIPPSTYRPRLADDRVGHFTTMHLDYSNDRAETPYVRYINRWNLEKGDPKAAVSVPKKPIVFWLENAIPEEYREAIAKGVLMWNPAFERIGFKDAVVVKQQPDDSDWDPADVRYSTIRWFIATDAGFAIGPSRTNPYTGEIYDADISFSESMTRNTRGGHQALIGPAAIEGILNASELLRRQNGAAACNYASEAAAEAAFGYDLLVARGGEMSPAAEDQYVKDFLTAIAAHEVGHTLGFRHNFRASTVHPFESLQDEKVASSGLTGSVMDYTPVNIAPKGVRQGHHWQTSLGAYDYWAVEYAYKPIAADSPEAERPELNRIASRVADANLAYGTDEDVFGNDPIGIDPRTNRWDFGSDPLTYYDARSTLGNELIQSIEQRMARPGRGYQRMRSAFGVAFGQVATSMMNAGKYVGGVYHNRDHVGDPGNRIPYEPVAAKDQRRSLALLNKYAFGEKAFDFQPQLLNKLAIDRDWTLDGRIFQTQRLDYPIHQQVLGLQRILLDRMYHPLLLARMQDSEVKYSKAEDRFTMAELFTDLRSSIWSELSGTGNINSFRRNLQRDHLKRLQRLVLRQDAGMPEDAATLARHDLTEISSMINARLNASGTSMDTITKAHLVETDARIKETLNAGIQRVVN